MMQRESDSAKYLNETMGFPCDDVIAVELDWMKKVQNGVGGL